MAPFHAMVRLTGQAPKKQETAERRSVQQEPLRNEIKATTTRKQARALSAASKGLPLNARARREKRAQQKHGKRSVKLRHLRVLVNRKKTI